MLFSMVLLALAMATAATTPYRLVLRTSAVYGGAGGSQSFELFGSDCGLSWAQGTALRAVANTAAWVANLDLNLCRNTTLQFKSKLNGQTWQIGANEQLDVTAAKKAAGGGSDLPFSQFFPFFETTEGRYFLLGKPLFSPLLKNQRQMVVYTPASFDENTFKRYELLLMHDGQNVFNASTSFQGVSWEAQRTINELVVTGGMREIVVVALYNTRDRINDYTYSADPSGTKGMPEHGGQGDLYLDFIESLVLPMVRAQFEGRLLPGAANQGMLGSSLGGLLSCYAGWTRPTVWRKVGCMSSSFWWNSQDFNGTVLAQNAAGVQPAKSQFYLDSGNAGPGNDDVTQTATVYAHFMRLGWKPSLDQIKHYVMKGGVHNEASWGARFWSPMTFLYPPANLAVSF